MEGEISLIYSEDIDKICALCIFSKKDDAEEERLFCGKKKKCVEITDTCKKFKYDIFKKTVRRKKTLTTDFTSEDFEI